MYLSDSDYKDVFSKSVRLCVDLVFDFGNRVLVGKRAHQPFKGEYGLPGGRVRFGESLSDAIDRIAMDEVGIVVKDSMIFDVCEFRDEKRGDLIAHTVSIAFVCRPENLPVLRDHFTELNTNRHVSEDDVLSQHCVLIGKYLGENGGTYIPVFPIPDALSGFRVLTG